MNLKLTKFRLRVAAVAMLLIAAAVVVLGALLPVGNASSTESMKSSALPTTRVTTTNPGDDIVSFSDVLDVELVRPLIEARAATLPSNLSAIDTTFGLRLTGTIMEPMHTYAILTDAGGKTFIKAVGESAGGASILAINADAVTMQVNGKPMVLHVVKPSTIGALVK